MNRLILVGNGFDLAHDLETSYKHFIDGFWESSFSEISRESIVGKVNLNNGIIEVSNENLVHIPTTNNKPEIKKYTDFTRELENYLFKHKIINEFFDTINTKFYFSNWVDIENEYYKALIEVKNNSHISKYKGVKKLNKDFEEVKLLLEKHLKKINKKIKIKNPINKHVQSIINLKDIESKYQKEIIKLIIKNTEIQNTNFYNDSSNSIKTFIKNIREQNNLEIENFVRVQVEALGNEILDVIDLYPINSLILNFNYTSTTSEYIDEFNELYRNKIDHNISEIHIHGELNNPNNPIIFGFGDDVDRKYQEFEDLNDNRYLENFKSIAYLQTDNYKKLLEFIDSEEYQVFIFGHSCGISDRTMLNTIFEHDNCKSIKPFYHRKKDDNGDYIVDDFGNFIDNYTEIVQNISRNFNDKKKYRDRVVNKTYCEPLT